MRQEYRFSEKRENARNRRVLHSVSGKESPKTNKQSVVGNLRVNDQSNVCAQCEMFGNTFWSESLRSSSCLCCSEITFLTGRTLAGVHLNPLKLSGVPRRVHDLIFSEIKHVVTSPDLLCITICLNSNR